MKLQINSLSKNYSGHEVLNEISFSIGDREFVGLIGENGSGKTTLLKIIAGLETPDNGSVQIIPKETTIGYIPQAPDRVENLSSGELARKYLAEVMAKQTDLLLLDEPTNHLDFEALQWLENYLKNYNGTVIAISHDRRFLDNLATKIMELDKGKIKIYGGNYSFYKERKRIETDAIIRQFEEQQRLVKRLERVVVEKKAKIQQLEKTDRPTRDSDKFASTFFMNRASRKFARVAQALESRLDRIEKIERPDPDLEMAAIFKPKIESSQTVIYLKDVNKNFGKQEVLNNFSLLINKGEKIAMIGPNGCGKTTLLNIILEKLQPDSGIVEIGNNVTIGYLPQEHEEENSNDDLLDNIINTTNIDKTSAYKLARRFLFSDDDLRTSVNKLSSGQKSKLALAKIMASGANFIILDEPTNHLDIPAREALETATTSYPGTLLFVTHDRYFLDVVNPDKIIEM